MVIYLQASENLELQEVGNLILGRNEKLGKYGFVLEWDGFSQFLYFRYNGCRGSALYLDYEPSFICGLRKVIGNEATNPDPSVGLDSVCEKQLYEMNFTPTKKLVFLMKIEKSYLGLEPPEHRESKLLERIARYLLIDSESVERAAIVSTLNRKWVVKEVFRGTVTYLEEAAASLRNSPRHRLPKLSPGTSK